jgi:LytTr DNA-binding domain
MSTEGSRRFELSRVAAPIAIILGAGLAVALVNAASTQTELGWRHIRVDPREPYVWELTSWCGLLVGLAPLLFADRLLQASRRWGARGAIVLAAGLAYSAAHIGTMLGLREAIYRLGGSRYHGAPLTPVVLYEFRKDALTVATILLALWLWRRALARPQAAVQPAAEPTFLAESRQGRVLLRAPEIDWVEAQGNYVALHAGGRSYLIRQPLKAMDLKLRGASFVRTHRSALVNTRRVRAIRREEGGLRVELANDESAPLSDRHKAAVVKALSPG